MCHAVVVQALTYVLRPTTAYRALELEVPASQLGLLSGAFAVVPLLIAIPVGRMTDLRGERLVLWTGAGLMLVATAGLAWLADSFMALLLWSVVLGVGHLLTIVGEQTTVTVARSARSLDSAFGRYTLSVSFGQIVGPGLITLLGGDGAIPDTSAIFDGAVVLAVVLVVSTAALRTSRYEPVRDAVPGSLRQAMSVTGPVRSELLTAITASLVLIAAIDLLVVYVPALGAQAGISAGTVGLLLSVRAAASMVSRMFVGGLVARFRRIPTLGASLAISSLAVAAIPVPMPLAVLFAVMALGGLTLGIGQPLTMAWVTEASPPGARATWLSVRLTGNRLGQTMVPTVAGLAASSAGVGGVLWVMAAALAGVALVVRRGRPA
ncbi:MFS transporter [Cellulomonas fimi]|uniref:MFS transporter n=1 Tax=Cellulomonas fimi TaxID=1708 RepID=A0A7Y0QGF9_CELFI|nr:MFS transporter [Cellulomonas fimi]NMR19053.1 MFS transporter [Cellulomonas fimi]